MAGQQTALTLAEALAITDDARVVTTIDPPYSIIHTNKAWHDACGYKFSEVAGGSCSILQGPATEPEGRAIMQRALEARELVKVTVTNYRKDGTPFTNMIECGPVSGGTHFYATIKPSPAKGVAPRPPAAPLQEARQAQPIPAPARPTRLRRLKSGPRLTDVLANTADPIVLCSKDYPHVITRPNAAWCEMCGYASEEVEGLTNSILTGPLTDKEAIERLLSCVRREETAVEAVVNYKKGGVPFLNQVTVAPVYDEQDELCSFMSMLREIDTSVPTAAA
jgi:PAS domain S-box-containing protein